MAVVLAVGKIEGQTLNSRLSSFCFVHPAQALLNSTAQLLTRDRRCAGRAAEEPIIQVDAFATLAQLENLVPKLLILGIVLRIFR